MLDIDLGRMGLSDRLATDRDIRATLEIRSSDPIASAFELLVAPNAPHIGRLHSAEQRQAVGQAALERFIATDSVVPSDYSDLMTNDDPFAYTWSPKRFFDPAPIGRAS